MVRSDEDKIEYMEDFWRIVVSMQAEQAMKRLAIWYFVKV